MRQTRTFKIVWLAGIALLLFSFITGCDNYQSITFENSIHTAIQVDAIPLQKDWDGKPTFEWDKSSPGIQPGQSVRGLSSVPAKRYPGKYLVEAIDQNNKLVFSKIFTWDELHEANWKVVIQ